MSASTARQPLRRYGLPALLVGGIGLVGLAPSADGDIWWHLAAGREMVARHEVLLSDPFSVSAAGRPWIDVHWLFQLAAYGVHRGFGLAGLVWVKCALLAAGALVLMAGLGRRAAADGTRAGFATLLLVALFAARSLLLLRPVIVTLVFLALFWWVLEVSRRRGKLAWLWALPPLQVLWANFQGLSALGPAVVSAFLVGAGVARLAEGTAWPFAPEVATRSAAGHRFKALLLALLGCCLACGVTPFGLRAFSLPLELARRLLPASENVYAGSVAENVPPYLLERYTGGEFWHLKWYLAVLSLAVLAAGRRLRLSHALLLCGFTALALMSNRNVLLLYWMATPIAALHLVPALRRWARGLRFASAEPLLVACNAVALCGVLAVASVAAAREPRLAEPTPFRAPLESARRLEQLPPGDIFSADHQGGYLIWQLYPRFRPYIDSRLVLRSADEFEEYLGLCEAPARFEAFQARHGFRYVVLPSAYPDRYLELIAHLYRSPDWKLLYTDGSEVLLAGADVVAEPGLDLGRGATVDGIARQLDARYAGAPELRAAARLQLGRLLAQLGELQQAERAVAGVSHVDTRALEARLRFAQGDSGAAERLARRALAEDPSDVASLNLLARIALYRGQAGLGTDFLKRALVADPFDTEAGRLLTRLQEDER